MVKTSLPKNQERGMAVLIVMLAVTVLTAVGVFAAHRSAMVTSASGYDRQSQQTRHIASYAGRLAASELGDGRASEVVRLMETSGDVCEANTGATRDARLVGPLPCYSLSPSEVTARLASQRLHSSLLDDATSGESAQSGSLSPPGGHPVEGLTRIEFFDRRQRPPSAGNDESAESPFRTVEFGVATWAQVRAVSPSSGSTEAPNSWAGARAHAGTASIQQLRTQIVVPNVTLTP